MPIIEIRTQIDADIKTCFDLARDIDFHQKSLEHSKERAIAGRTSGLIGLEESVTWEATHLGIKQQLTSKITQFNSPNYFVDEQVSGAFKSFKHEHIFNVINESKTKMIDCFEFVSPFGVLGKLINWLFLSKYMKKLLITRANHLKEEAEHKFASCQQ